MIEFDPTILARIQFAANISFHILFPTIFIGHGKLSPTFPNWMLKGTQPTRKAWFLKKNILPKLYWDGMLKGHEWLVSPKKQQDHSK